MKQNLTYIIESQGHYKIGKTTNLYNRLCTYETHCFQFILICIIEKDVEGILHKLYEHKRVKLEWFALNAEDLRNISTFCENLSLENILVNKDWRTLDLVKLINHHKRKRKSKGIDSRKKVLKKDKFGNLLEEFSSAVEAARSMSSDPHVFRTALRKRGKYKGFYWSYK